MSDYKEELPKFALGKSLSEIIPNLIFFGIGVPVIIALGMWLHFLGIIGFGIYAIILIIDILRIAFAIVSGIFILFFDGKSHLKSQAYNWITTFIQLIEMSVFAVYVIILYKFLF